MDNDKAIESWLKATNSKGPFYLYRFEPFKQKVYKNGKETGFKDYMRYFVIWKQKEKTKFGYFEDGMWTRYGVNVIAVLTGTNVTGLWQSRPNSVDENILKAMINVAKGNTKNVPYFSPETIRDLCY